MRSIVYYYTHVQQPFANLAAVLSHDPGAWLPAPAEPSDGGWLVTLHADGAVPQPLAAHQAHVRIGPPTRAESTLLRSIAWRSAVADRLVPMLEADLELASLNGSGCQLSLMGSYRPPLSVVGAAGDRLLGHRVAEACVRRFVLEAAERLETAMLQT